MQEINYYFLLWFIPTIVLIILLIRRLVIWSQIIEFKPRFNSKTQVDQFNSEIKAAGFQYDPCQDIFYSTKDAWQKNYGYRELFDEMAPQFNMIIDSEPVKFDYNGRNWMIEFWKGQYGITTGAEVGIYVSDNRKTYQCVEEKDEIYMGFTIQKNGEILARRVEKHWWLTAFVLGEYSKPEELVLVIELMLKDEEMCHAFVDALRKIGYKRTDYYVRGNTVRIYYSHPYTEQPKTRRTLQAKIAMMMNKYNCKIYRKITKNEKCTLDKIEYIRIRVPRIYKFMIKLLDIWKSINA
ncbi:DUF4474 domain-containing protein [Lachnospiraceae bacterium LCP25S3_G4]